MSSLSTHPATGSLSIGRIGYGIVGGLLGGVVFGVLMQMMDMIPMVAMLVGSEAAGVGWLVHLAISAFIGASFAVLFGRWATNLGSAVGIGLGYGVVWWGPRRPHPYARQARHGRVHIQHHGMAEPDGPHMIYGAILGAVFAFLVRRATH